MMLMLSLKRCKKKVVIMGAISNDPVSVRLSSARQQNSHLLLHALQETLQDLPDFCGAFAVPGAQTKSREGMCACLYS